LDELVVGEPDFPVLRTESPIRYPALPLSNIATANTIVMALLFNPVDKLTRTLLKVNPQRTLREFYYAADGRA
jgi:hypothetical protein